MSITLWGRRSSGNVQKVVWALEELELAYEHIELGGKFGGTDTPQYRAMNPNGLVPTLSDGDLTIWESHAIVRYLSAEYGSGLLFPVEPRERAIVDQWTDWTATSFQLAWSGLFWAKVRTPLPKQDPAAISRALANAIRHFEILEARLGQVPFLAGEQLTYADIVAGVSLFRWTTMGIEAPHLPNVDAWHQRLRARPAFVKGVEVSYADLVGSLPA